VEVRGGAGRAVTVVASAPDAGLALRGLFTNAPSSERIAIVHDNNSS